MMPQAGGWAWALGEECVIGVHRRSCRVSWSVVLSDFAPDFKRMLERAGPYPPQAYQFIRDGLAHTVKHLHGDGNVEDESRHVTGQQLCLGLKDFAIKQYGLLARTVLGSWSIHSTEDFGKIVLAMIEEGFMRKNDDDKIQDFTGVFEFDEAFQDLTGSAR